MQGGDWRQGCSDDHQEIEEMAHCLILLAKGQTDTSQPAAAAEAHRCKTCDKSFPSFQALGGHRANHKKPIDEKKSSLMKDDEREFTTLSLKITSTRRVHECSICGAGFLSGQALGGHMRRHRPMPEAATGGNGKSREAKRPKTMSLDLNLPAPQDYDQKESNFSFSTKEQVIIFSASPLIN